MKRVIIVGNSGAARECYWLFDDMRKSQADFERKHKFFGFLSWDNFPENLKGLSEFMLGDVQDYVPEPNDLFVIGVGNPSLRRDIFEYLKKQQCTFLTLKHPQSFIYESACIGEGNIFQLNSSVFADANLGNANYLNGCVNLSHDCLVGDYNFLGPFTLILGEAKLGNANSLGANCSLLPKSRVGDENILAPGCVVYKGCKNSCRIQGNPAVNIGSVNMSVVTKQSSGDVK